MTLKYIGTYFFIILMFILAGCLQSRHEFSLNPDGAGKVIYEISYPLEDFISDEEKSIKVQAIEEVDKILKSSKGIEVWKDVYYEITDEGKFYFKGTAYFTNISTVEIGGSIRGNTWETQFNRLPNGYLEIVFPQKDDPKKEIPQPPKKLSKKELKEKTKISIAKFKQSMPLLESFLKDYRLEKIFHLPGKISEISTFKKLSSQTVNIVYSGDKILNVIKEVINNETLWKDFIDKGYDMKDGPPDSYISGQILGSNLPPRVLVAPETNQLFNYPKEVAEARKLYSHMRQKLGLSKEIKLYPPAKDKLLKNIRVAGIRYVAESDPQNNISPFGQKPGYTFSIIGEFTGSIINIHKARTKIAITDKEENILPDENYDKDIHSKLSKDKTKLILNIKTRIPGKSAKRINEISGEIIYETAEGTKEISLGMMKLAPGSKGKVLNAEIKEMKECEYQKNSYLLEIKFDAQESHIKEIKLIEPDGKISKLFPSVRTILTNSVMLTLSRKNPYPPAGEIVVKMYKNVKRYNIPFKIENIRLF